MEGWEDVSGGRSNSKSSGLRVCVREGVSDGMMGRWDGDVQSADLQLHGRRRAPLVAPRGRRVGRGSGAGQHPGAHGALLAIVELLQERATLFERDGAEVPVHLLLELPPERVTATQVHMPGTTVVEQSAQSASKPIMLIRQQIQCSSTESVAPETHQPRRRAAVHGLGVHS